ncbi:hypothetical protein [Priestia megaterium]|uniref:hypothetical protein n=1 Tax=Priestia megaterium TaxID=1404 RepID=UPI00367041A6
MSKENILGTAAPFESVLDWALHPAEHAKEMGTNAMYAHIEPFLDILCVVSYPMASVIIGIAGLLYILNLKDKSISWMTKTSLTYVLIQLLPMLLKSLLQMM